VDSKRNTIQRRLIYAALKELDIHATAEQVFDYVARESPSISKATVYRNLGQMVCSGEVAEIGCFNGVRHYDHNCHKHYHFICKVCNQIFDVEGDFSSVCDMIEDKSGFDIEVCNISFSGLCWNCRDTL